ncbi:MAG: TatD family hydrolase [Clostridia bacterium]|nr:TatD family hydrolase [Clostridia bacterium]
MKYFDSHAHYWDKRFEGETPEGVDACIDTLFRENVCGIVNVGTSPFTTRLAIAQAKRFPHMYVAGGIHPSDVAELANVDEALSELEQLLKVPENKIVALGEIGLDYHFLPFDKELQLSVFHAQMEMAERLSLPVVIHDREAHGDCFDVVRAHPNVRGVFHSYSGSAEMAKDLVRRGYMISFSGTVSFKNARSVKEAASALPHDAVLIETDAPYLAPHPHRGKLNHSGYLSYTCAALAEAWGISEEETARLTRENARCFFGLEE